MAYNQPIQRRLVAAVTKEYEQRGQVAPQQTAQEQTPVMLPTVFFGLNDSTTSATIKPGSRLFVYDFWPETLSYANAVKQIYRNKIKFEVGLAPSFMPTPSEEGFYALTPAKNHRICQFYSPSNLYYLAHVNAALPEGYDGEKIEAHYRYVDINGVATNDEENAYAEIRFGTPIDNGYAVAFCKRIVKSLTAAEATNNTMAYLDAQKKVNATVVTNASFAVDSNGFLEIVNTTERITYYGVSQS